MKKFITTRGYHRNETPTVVTWSEDSFSLPLKKHIPRDATLKTSMSYDEISETDSGIGTSDVSETSTPLVSPNVILPFPAFPDDTFKSSDGTMERTCKLNMAAKCCGEKSLPPLSNLNHLEIRNSPSEEQFLKVLQNIRRTNLSYQNITSPSLDAITRPNCIIKSSGTLPRRVTCSHSTSNLHKVSDEISSTNRFSTLKLRKKKMYASSRSILNNDIEVAESSSSPVLVAGDTSTFPRNFYKFRRKVPTLAKHSQNQVLVFNRSASIASEGCMTSNDMTSSSVANIDRKTGSVKFIEKLNKPYNANKLKNTGHLNMIPRGSNGNSGSKTSNCVTFNSTLPLIYNSRSQAKPKFSSEQVLTCCTNQWNLSKTIESCSAAPLTSATVSSIQNKYLGASNVQEALRDLTLWNDLLGKVASGDPPSNKILKQDDFNAKRMMCKRAIRSFAINVKNTILHYESSSFADCVRLSCSLSYADVISSSTLFLDFISIPEQRISLAKDVSAVGQSFCETVKLGLTSAVKRSGCDSRDLFFASGRRFTENMNNLVSHVTGMKWDCITKKF